MVRGMLSVACRRVAERSEPAGVESRSFHGVRHDARNLATRNTQQPVSAAQPAPRHPVRRHAWLRPAAQVLVRDPSGEHVLLVKGADNVIFDRAARVGAGAARLEGLADDLLEFAKLGAPQCHVA